VVTVRADGRMARAADRKLQLRCGHPVATRGKQMWGSDVCAWQLAAQFIN